MENKKIIYAVNSDLDDDLFYAEFDTMDKALKYAEDHLDKLPFIDEVEVVVDDGGYEDAVSYTTVWDYTKAESQDQSADPTKKLDDKAAQVEDDFWDFSTRGYSEKEKEAIRDKARADKGSWLESLDDLVEDMEENEDMVECKECFDLFPKADCVKLTFGYICPCCNKGAEVADSDIFKIDFPEYEKFNCENDMIPSEPNPEPMPDTFPNPEPMPEFEGSEGESELTPEEVIPFLVNDEVEAIAGYEEAAEVITDSDVENKEEILDVIDHIKEEEEEHIEELQDLVDTEDDEIIEVENDPISDEAKEVEEPAVDAEESEILVEESHETKYWMCFYDNNDVCVLEADTEEEAEAQFYDDYSDSLVFKARDHHWAVEEISKEEYDEYEGGYSVEPVYDREFDYLLDQNLTEHILDRAEPIESDQELEGTDNAVVKCKVADVITHSEDEKPLNCEMKDKPLEKPLTEATTSELDEIARLCKEIGITTAGDLELFNKEEEARGENLLDRLRSYRAWLGDDFKLVEGIFDLFKNKKCKCDHCGKELKQKDCSFCEYTAQGEKEIDTSYFWYCKDCLKAVSAEISDSSEIKVIDKPTEQQLADYDKTKGFRKFS